MKTGFYSYRTLSGYSYSDLEEIIFLIKTVDVPKFGLCWDFYQFSCNDVDRYRQIYFDKMIEHKRMVEL